MSIPGLSTTTLSVTGGIDGRVTRITLASTTGITGAGSVTTAQSAIVIDGEKMLVQSVPISGVVEVIRGVDSAAKPHANGAVVYIGTKAAFGFQNADGNMGLLGTGGTPDGVLPAYVLPLGARRVENGKEYILCDFTATVHTGVVVGISNDGLFTAAPFTTAFQGAVGVVAEQTSTSDQWGWVQIYGSASAQDASATSGITSAYAPIVATSVSSPATGMTAVAFTAASTPVSFIYGMFITADATTAVTSAASHTGVGLPVFLNYPYVMQLLNGGLS
jgi:hypothetical protein